MHLDKNLHIGSDSVTHCLNQFDRPQLLAAVEFIEARAEGIELEGMVALLKHTFGCSMEFLRSALDRIPAIRVGLDLVSHCAPQELINRLPKHLTYNIPTGNLYRRDGRHSNLASPRVVVQVHAPHQILDIGRIMTQYVVGHGLRKVSEQRISMIEHAYLANALEPVIGDDTHEGQVAPRSPHHR